MTILLGAILGILIWGFIDLSNKLEKLHSEVANLHEFLDDRFGIESIQQDDV